MEKKQQPESDNSWARSEFGEADFGDNRLNERLIRIADRLAESPESPINQACSGWAETKGAYRFFRNDSVDPIQILTPHIAQTNKRASAHKIILAIQDTSYFSYTSHKKTKGLGLISIQTGVNVKKIPNQGVIMHTAFAVSTQGLPLGILDQKIFSRQPGSVEFRELKRKSGGNGVAIEEKESYRWLESLSTTEKSVDAATTKVVTVCDREADIYDFFELALRINASVLVRACKDRRIEFDLQNSEGGTGKLWSSVQGMECKGRIQVEVPARAGKPFRVATLELRFGEFFIKPSSNNIRHATENLPNLKLNAVYVLEKDPPANAEALEWMLLTNLKVTSFDEAIEKVRWYCLRWRIEVFHKILKSGLNVEDCRLGTADRLIRYLTVMSIIAWRIFWITILARSDPSLSCTVVLEEHEWKVLHSKFSKTKTLPTQTPNVREAIRWIAQLGGFLARNGDGEPGTITLWRGWKRLCDLSEGWSLALNL